MTTTEATCPTCKLTVASWTSYRLTYPGRVGAARYTERTESAHRLPSGLLGACPGPTN